MAELVNAPGFEGRPRRPAVFLDRDGVINHDSGWISSPDELVILRGAATAIALLNHAGFLVLVVSNQSIIARGVATADTVDSIHRVMSAQLSRDGARIDGYYYCPHHPDFTGSCGCRKPSIGLIEKARAEHAIDFEASFFIGDTTSDILTGRRAGLRTVLVRTGKGGHDGLFEVCPDATYDDLLAAAQWITKTEDENPRTVK